MHDKFRLYKAIQAADKMPSYSGKYILDGSTPVPELNLLRWGIWFEQHDRKVAVGYIKRPAKNWFWRLLGYKDTYKVSTVFLGLDHSFSEGPPLLFETMVFKNRTGEDLYQDRCSTWEQALDMHDKAHEWVWKNT